MAADWMSFSDVCEACELSYVMWELGWDEANGGNISCILSDDEIERLGYVPGNGRMCA